MTATTRTSRHQCRRGPDGTVTHCARGHEFTGHNVYENGRGHRQCRICRVDRETERRAAKRAEQWAAASAPNPVPSPEPQAMP